MYNIVMFSPRTLTLSVRAYRGATNRAAHRTTARIVAAAVDGRPRYYSSLYTAVRRTRTARLVVVFADYSSLKFKKINK